MKKNAVLFFVLLTFMFFAQSNVFSANGAASKETPTTPFKFCFWPNFGIPLTKDVHGGCIGIMNYGNVRGIDLGIVSLTENVNGGKIAIITNGKDVDGVELGIANFQKTMSGFQAGIYNRSTTFNAGGQLGIINRSDNSDGMQFGIINIMKNGFLKVFPFINFPKKWFQ